MKKIVKVLGNVKEAIEDWKVVESNGKTFLETSVGKDRKFSLICNEGVKENCKESIDWDKLDLIPLYKNCIVDYKDNEKNFDNKLIVKIVSENPIASIKLDNAYLLTPIIQDKHIDEGVNEVAFAITTMTQDFFIRVYTENGQLFKYSLNEESTIDLTYQVRKQANKLKAPTYLKLPKKVYITDNTKENRIKDHISIYYKDLVSKQTKIEAERTKEVILDPRITDKIDEKTIKVFIPNAVVKVFKKTMNNKFRRRKPRQNKTK